MRTDIDERIEEIIKWINEKRSKQFICKQLHCKPETLSRYLRKNRISYDGNQGSKGYKKIIKKSRYMTLEEYLKNSKNIQSNKVRNKLLKEGYKAHQCERCKNTHWLGQLIPLELHHKDGNSNNNTIENYELLCPNCHAFTDSYRGKNSRKNV